MIRRLVSKIKPFHKNTSTSELLPYTEGAMISKAILTLIQRHATWSLLRLLVIMTLVPWLGGASLAQTSTFDSGSNGSDGALNMTTPGIYIFDPRTFNPPLDPDGDNIYHFTTITIAAGVTVRMLGSHLNMKPVFWLASGAVQIAGTINLDGENGQNGQDYINSGSRFSSVPGPGGFGGGVGAYENVSAQRGNGPGGGGLSSRSDSYDGGGAGHATTGASGTNNGGAPYGNDFLLPLVGGSGGGGYGHANGKGGGGGAGGGALLLASSISITVTGAIHANGGEGGSSTIGFLGGAGSGGSIRLVAPTIAGTGTLSAQGGGVSRAFLRASDGRIRLEAFQHTFTGTINPVPRRATPFAVFLPASQPSVRVVSIAGTNLPVVPTGSFATPDVTINSASAVTLNIEARNIPVGTVIKLHMYSENNADQIVDSTPLAGTFAQSIATASVTVPSGFSRMYVRATWTP
jgi:hypothetical protein